ncbi:MAG: hypothetical protein WKF64_07270 [Ilumatobacteraceae bacterium]
MANVYTQLKGSCKLGPTLGTLVEYNGSVYGFQFRNMRTMESIAATLLTGEEDTEAGARADSLSLMYLVEQAITGLFSELEDAYETDDAELFFDIVASPAAVSVDNQRYTGKIVVDRVAVGGEVGKPRQETPEYSIKAGTYLAASV